MKRLLLPLLAALALPSAVNAGIPIERDVWMGIDLKPGIWTIDTSEFKLKKKTITFVVRRQQEKDEASDGVKTLSWTGKYRVYCKAFKSKGLNAPWGYGEPAEKIQPNTIEYVLADNLCYLTGVEGYTPNENPPKWVKKIISNIEIKKVKKPKKVRNINCQSPVFKNKPICN